MLTLDALADSRGIRLPLLADRHRPPSTQCPDYIHRIAVLVSRAIDGSGLREETQTRESGKLRNIRPVTQEEACTARMRSDTSASNTHLCGGLFVCDTWLGLALSPFRGFLTSTFCSRRASCRDWPRPIRAVAREYVPCFQGWTYKQLWRRYYTLDIWRAIRLCSCVLAGSRCVALFACTLSKSFPCVSTLNFNTGGYGVAVS